MIGSLNISLSGMRAAETRLSIAANNVVNVSSAGHTAKGAAEAGNNAQAPYKPVSASTTSVSGGGVVVNRISIDPASYSVFAPHNPLSDSDGMVAYPNVSLSEQLIEMKLASLSYKANVKVLEAQSELLGTLLDSLS